MIFKYDRFKSHIYESSKKNDWSLFARKISKQLKAGSLNYPFSEEEYYVKHDEIETEWRKDYDQTYSIGKTESYREITSTPDRLWVIKQIADKIGGSINICDMGCGLGLVVLFCQKMGLQATGVEYQQRLKPLHNDLGIDVKYGDFFTMDLSFLKEQDIVYLYQPMSYTQDSIRLLNLIHRHTKPDVVVLYNGMFEDVFRKVEDSGKYNSELLTISNTNDSYLVLLTKKPRY